MVYQRGGRVVVRSLYRLRAQQRRLPVVAHARRLAAYRTHYVRHYLNKQASFPLNVRLVCHQYFIFYCDKQSYNGYKMAIKYYYLFFTITYLMHVRDMGVKSSHYLYPQCSLKISRNLGRFTILYLK